VGVWSKQPEATVPAAHDDPASKLSFEPPRLEGMFRIPGRR